MEHFKPQHIMFAADAEGKCTTLTRCSFCVRYDPAAGCRCAQAGDADACTAYAPVPREEVPARWQRIFAAVRPSGGDTITR